MPKERHVDALLKKLVQTIEASLSKNATPSSAMAGTMAVTNRINAMRTIF